MSIANGITGMTARTSRMNIKRLAEPLNRRAEISNAPGILSTIYEHDINLSLWRRQYEPSIAESVITLLETKGFSQLKLMLPAQNVAHSLKDQLPDFANRQPLIKDISLLAEMFACLFDLDAVGLRLTTLDKAMCPRFHVDRIPCRLVTTYIGPGTEWLRHGHVDHRKLGAGNNGLSDDRSGLFQNLCDIQRLQPGDVALLKGELWEGNEGGGLVHRSPAVVNGHKRLLLTLDFA